MGGTQSNIYSYPGQPLSDSSYYKPIEESFTKARKGLGDRKDIWIF